MVIMSTIEEAHLTEDLILVILSYLPPITLLGFKSVSKTWYSLISNPDFCRRHTALYHHMLEEPSSSPGPGILLRRKLCAGDSNIVIHPHPRGLDHEQKNLALLLQNLNDYRPALNESSAPPKKESFMLTDSCNGLLLYVHKFTRKEEAEEKEIVCRNFYVCNPITKDYIKLPTIDIIDIGIDEFKEQEQAVKIAQIVFNPSFSLTYKVFTWVQCVKRSSSRSDSSNYYQRLYVYSSEARSWRLSVPEFRQLFSFDSKAVLWNGVLHWTTFVCARTTDAVCYCYDIEKETVWTMKFPKMATGYTHRRRLLYFGLCGERLLLIQKSFNNDLECFPTSFDVMEKQHNRNGDGDGDGEDMWSVRYHVNFKEVDYDYYLRPKVITNSFMGSYVSILDIYRTMGRNKKGEEEEEEEMLLIKVGSNKMISFSLTNNSFGIEELSNREIDSSLNHSLSLSFR